MIPKNSSHIKTVLFVAFSLFAVATASAVLVDENGFNGGKTYDAETLQLLIIRVGNVGSSSFNEGAGVITTSDGDSNAARFDTNLLNILIFDADTSAA